jgi:hypothetical protein
MIYFYSFGKTGRWPEGHPFFDEPGGGEMDLKTFLNLQKTFEEILDDQEMEDFKRFLADNRFSMSPGVVLRVILTLNRAIPLTSDPELKREMESAKGILKNRILEVIE